MMMARDNQPFPVSLRRCRVKTEDDVDLSVQEAGPEDADALLIVNGPGADYRAWRGFFAEFSQRYRVITWDLRGTFDSVAHVDTHELNPEAHARDLRDILDSLGIDRCVVVSWSLGSQIVLEAWRHAPETFRGFVAVNGSYGRPFERSANLRGVSSLKWVTDMVPEQQDLLGKGVRFLEDHRSLLHAAKALHLVSPVIDEQSFLTIAGAFSSINMTAYRALLKAFGEHDAEHVLATIRCPSLFFAGRRDPLMPSRYSEFMARRVLRSELLVIPIASHYIPVEFSEYLNLRVEAFLEERVYGRHF
jgi:pimeloyl-ACP methyl ester carboxylesterase